MLQYVIMLLHVTMLQCHNVKICHNVTICNNVTRVVFVANALGFLFVYLAIFPHTNFITLKVVSLKKYTY